MFSDYLKTTGVNFIIGVFVEFLKIDAAHGKIMVAILKAKISSRTGCNWLKTLNYLNQSFPGVVKARLIFEFDESSVFPIQTGGSHIFQVSSLSYTRGKISFARSRKSCKEFEIILIRSQVMGKTFNFEHCPSTVNHLQSLSKRNF